MSGLILIQGAMDVETDWLAAVLEHPTELELGGFRFWRGRCCGVELAVSRTGIGTVDCACATTLGVREFAPILVVNQGVAGAHCETLHVGDIVVGEDCIRIHDILTPQRGRGEGSDPFIWALHDHANDTVPRIYTSHPAWTERFMAVPYTGGAKIAGRLGCGDVFNREADRILWLGEWAGHLCEDMESAAAYQVCAHFHIPCVGLRIISNNELTGEAYRREVGVALQEFIIGVLTKQENKQ